MSMKDWETNGQRNGKWIFCTVNAIGDCPYCDNEGHCHIADPVAECDDFGAFFGSWEEYDEADEVDEDTPKDFSKDEIEWARRHFGYRTDYNEVEDYPDDEIGFNPYIGAYDYDC